MRELGFSKKWPKLENLIFTTFRFQRKDRDWEAGEVVRIVYKPQSKEREILGIARIIAKGLRDITGWDQSGVLPTLHPKLTNEDAIADGFSGRAEMFSWLRNTYRGQDHSNQINKLTLQWRER